MAATRNASPGARNAPGGSKIARLLHRRRTAGFGQAQVRAMWPRPGQQLELVRDLESD